MPAEEFTARFDEASTLVALISYITLGRSEFRPTCESDGGTPVLMRRERAYTAVAVMLDIGWYAGRQRLESAGDIADRLAMARRGIEPVLQGLARAGLLDSTRGPKGGYRLGKSARQITLAEVVEAVTTGDGVEPVESEAGGELQSAAVEPLWTELEQHVQTYLQNITLEALIQRAQAQGLKRPAHAPIVFAI